MFASASNSPRVTITRRTQACSNRGRGNQITHQKPSHLSVYRMEIGQWSETAEFNGVLMLKIYHCRGQIIFERLCRGRKRKIEYSLEEVSKIFLYHHTSRVSVAEFFVTHIPTCYCEVDPTPRSNTLWEACEDDFCSQQSLVAKSLRCYLKTSTSTKQFIRLQSHPVVNSKIFFHPPSPEDWMAVGDNAERASSNAIKDKQNAPPIYAGWGNLYVQHMAARLGIRNICDDGESSSTSNSSLQSSPCNSDHDSCDNGSQGQEQYVPFDAGMDFDII